MLAFRSKTIVFHHPLAVGWGSSKSVPGPKPDSFATMRILWMVQKSCTSWKRWFLPPFIGFQPSFWWCRISSIHRSALIHTNTRLLDMTLLIHALSLLEALPFSVHALLNWPGRVLPGMIVRHFRGARVPRCGWASYEDYGISCPSAFRSFMIWSPWRYLKVTELSRLRHTKKNPGVNLNHHLVSTRLRAANRGKAES